MATDTLVPFPRTTNKENNENTNPKEERELIKMLQNRPRQKAISELEPVLHILERFHHRNKNQHRINKWWAEADMLRRQVRKLIEGLRAGLVDEERNVRMQEMLAKKGSSVAVKKRKGKEQGEEDENGFKKDEFGIYERAVYIRGMLVPRAWFAFTQLVADKQFAQLGLMLLAVLAQIDQALSPFAPGAEPDGEAEDNRETLLSAPAAVIGAVGLGGAPEEESGEDVGVAISRDEILGDDLIVSTRAGMDFDTDGDGDVDMDDDHDTPSSPTKATTEPDKKFFDITAIKPEEIDGKDEDDSAINSRKKKRPRVEEEKQNDHGEWGGISDGEEQDDEFGSIFASLIPKKKKKVKVAASSVKTTIKTKKQKEEEDEPEDDIGNIFAGLISTEKKKKKVNATPKSTKTVTKIENEEQEGPEDDIDNIFDSLIPKKVTKKKSPTTATATVSAKAKVKEGSKEKKKRKKKQGDAFDDIFGGLL
ncbi:hypothetical protein V8F20_002286 [Naviculisporaceae sp. PSN 640]